MAAEHKLPVVNPSPKKPEIKEPFRLEGDTLFWRVRDGETGREVEIPIVRHSAGTTFDSAFKAFGLK